MTRITVRLLTVQKRSFSSLQWLAWGILLINRDKTFPAMKFFTVGERKILSTFSAMRLFAEHRRWKAEITSFRNTGFDSSLLNFSEANSASNLSALLMSFKAGDDCLLICSNSLKLIGRVTLPLSCLVRLRFGASSILGTCSDFRFRWCEEALGLLRKSLG